MSSNNHIASRRMLLCLLFLCSALQLIAGIPAGKINGVRGTVRSQTSVLQFANVTTTNQTCHPQTQITNATGAFLITCDGAGTHVHVKVWARQFATVEEVLPLNTSMTTAISITLSPRPITGFPVSDWRFEGWAVQAQTRDVPGTDISFLAHPTVVRTIDNADPNKKYFMFTTANTHAGTYLQGVPVVMDSCRSHHTARALRLCFVVCYPPAGRLRWVLLAILLWC